MRLGLQLPNPGGPTRESLTLVARAAEELGYDSVWTNSHVAIPVEFRSKHPYTKDGRAPWSAETAWADAMVILGFVAALTERVRIGVNVVPLIVTDPLTLAKQAATLDVVSGGRLELGIGAGWLVEEAQALGRPTDHRGARLMETIDVLRLAFTRPTFRYDGQRVRIPPVGINPRPPQGGALPLWIGGKSDAVVELAAERGAGLFLWVPTASDVRAYRGRLDALGSRAPLAASLSLGAAGSRWRDAIAEMADAGADLLVLMRRVDDGARADYERIADAFALSGTGGGSPSSAPAR